MAELELEIVEVIDDNDDDDDDDDDDIEFKRAFESNFVRGLAIGLRYAAVRLYPRNDWKWKFSDENDAKALDFDQIRCLWHS